MAKVLLVEDDNNLREIYQARLMAEGYDIVSARDGEEALVVAKQEMPDLVISDVMMPKISGFEMLDILRNTEGLQHVKVIMLTALGQAEDQSRADSLGADRYLVKSQVTLEDIVNAASDLLRQVPAAAAPADNASAQPAEPAATDAAAPAAAPTVEAAPVASAPQPEAPAPEAPAAFAQTEPAVSAPPVIPLATAPPETPDEPVTPSMPPTAESTVPEVPAAEPVATEPAPAAPAAPLVDDTPVTAEPAPATDAPAEAAEPQSSEPQTNAEEAATVEQQIETFVATQSGNPEPQVEPSADTAAPVEPETTAPEAAATTTTPEQEQALNDALTNLGGAPATTDAPASDAPAAADEPAATATANAVDPPADADPGDESASGSAPSSATENAVAGHKRVIEPLNDPNEPKKNLDELLAAEDAKENGESANGDQKPAGKNDFDPNSIAL